MPRQRPRLGAWPAGSLRAGLLRDTLLSGAEESRSLLEGLGTRGSTSLHSMWVSCAKGLWQARLPHGEQSSQVTSAAASACLKSVRHTMRTSPLSHITPRKRAPHDQSLAASLSIVATQSPQAVAFLVAMQIRSDLIAQLRSQRDSALHMAGEGGLWHPLLTTGLSPPSAKCKTSLASPKPPALSC